MRVLWRVGGCEPTLFPAVVMGERKGTNKYYPPDFDWRSHDTLNAYHGVHPLRERAKKINKGVVVIRFELPWHIWCLSCGKHVGKGVRYNAEKKAVGNYHSTKIWEFSMRCHLCSGSIVMRTDPQHMDYQVVSGARRKIETWEAEPEDGAPVLLDEDQRRRLDEDPFYRLEHQKDAKESSTKAASAVDLLLDIRSRRADSDISLNRQLRKRVRDEKQTERRKDKEMRREQKRLGVRVKLLPENPSDLARAQAVRFGTPACIGTRKRRKAITSQSVFKDSYK